MLKSGLKSLNPEILAIFDCALEGIMIADVNYAVCYVNPAYTRMTGRKPEEEIGRVLRLETPFGPLREAIAARRPIYGQRYHPDGSKVELIVNASPLIVNEEVIGGVSFCQDITDILELTKKLSQRSRLVKSLTEKLEGLCGARYSFEHIVGESSAIRQIIKVAKKAAAGASTVLLTGESGTGKELFAHAMHHASPREHRPFLKVNCAAIPENLLESEFFGYEKGAFTGAVSRKMGLFERADGGTIFLDEIGDMSLSLQSKLLRFLQDGEVTRLGGWRPIEVDVRAIAATNRNLSQMIKEGSFREELYYRVNVVGINIPSLRERRQDIPLLIAHILRRVNRELGKQVQEVDKQAMDKLLAYHWPGNIRELENVLERAVNLVEGSLIRAEVILLPDIIAVAGKTEPASGEVKAGADKDLALICSLAAQERELVRRAIAAYGTSLKGKRQAAKVLGMSLATLYKRIKALEVH
jgi:PAS domain S-box-containing protein